MKISLIFAWYDLWIGVFVDHLKHRIYICVGLVIEWRKP